MGTDVRCVWGSIGMILWDFEFYEVLFEFCLQVVPSISANCGVFWPKSFTLSKFTKNLTLYDAKILVAQFLIQKINKKSSQGHITHRHNILLFFIDFMLISKNIFLSVFLPFLHSKISKAHSSHWHRKNMGRSVRRKM